MKIGIDLDGVVFDSETIFRVYEEIFAIENLNNRPIINLEEPKYQGRYNWSNEEQNEFNKQYLLKGAIESNLMPGFKIIFDKLKKQGHEFIVITARGGFFDEMIDIAKELLEKNNIKFDKYYWKIYNKLEICKNENIDIMIDDDYNNIEQLVNGGIKTLYFRDTNMKKLPESKLIHEVNNWGDIYRYFYNLNNF